MEARRRKRLRSQRSLTHAGGFVGQADDVPGSEDITSTSSMTRVSRRRRATVPAYTQVGAWRWFVQPVGIAPTRLGPWHLAPRCPSAHIRDIGARRHSATPRRRGLGRYTALSRETPHVPTATPTSSDQVIWHGVVSSQRETAVFVRWPTHARTFGSARKAAKWFGGSLSFPRADTEDRHVPSERPSHRDDCLTWVTRSRGAVALELKNTAEVSCADVAGVRARVSTGLARLRSDTSGQVLRHLLSFRSI